MIIKGALFRAPFNNQILYVNIKTKTPDKMEIVDNEENPRFIVTYEDFKYNK